MTHADSLHYQPTQGCGNFIYKILVLGHQKAQVEPIHVWNIDKDFMVHELTPVLHRRSTNELKSTGKDSSQEGLNVSHINDTKHVTMI
jgi:hypothetical protein